MCGIIACLGSNVSLHIINGLKQLQNRGYDSAGISLIYENEYKLYKHLLVLTILREYIVLSFIMIIIDC